MDPEGHLFWRSQKLYAGFGLHWEGVESVRLTPMLLKDQLLSSFGGGKLKPVNYREWESSAQNLVTVKA